MSFLRCLFHYYRLDFKLIFYKCVKPNTFVLIYLVSLGNCIEILLVPPSMDYILKDVQIKGHDGSIRITKIQECQLFFNYITLSAKLQWRGVRNTHIPIPILITMADNVSRLRCSTTLSPWYQAVFPSQLMNMWGPFSTPEADDCGIISWRKGKSMFWKGNLRETLTVFLTKSFC